MIKKACCDDVGGAIICYTSYSQAFDDAKERMKRGQSQCYCWACQKWQWPDGCEHEKSTKREFDMLVRRATAAAKAEARAVAKVRAKFRRLPE